MQVVGLFCVCGNRLEERPFRVIHSPCRCVRPGHGPTVVRLEERFLDHISPRQYAERKRLGLPVVAEVEKTVFREEKRHARSE